MILSGRIHNSDERFRGKAIRIELGFPADREWEYAIKTREEAESVSGVVRINANVEPERFELYGEESEEEPVQASVAVSSEAFEAFRRQAVEAYDRKRVLRASIKLVGKSLPYQASESLLFPSLRIHDLADLDVSNLREYAVGSFKLLDTRDVDRYRGRVLGIDGMREGAKISVLLTEGQWCIDMARGRVHSIRCEGRIVRPSRDSYSNADVSIEFDHHECSMITDELPERAYAGEFGYWPRDGNRPDSPPHFWANLKHVPDDIANIILPALTHDEMTQVLLSITLRIEKERLEAANQEMKGEVLSYSFEISRRFAEKTESAV